jgi:hypothetical protein
MSYLPWTNLLIVDIIAQINVSGNSLFYGYSGFLGFVDTVDNVDEILVKTCKNM